MTIRRGTKPVHGHKPQIRLPYFHIPTLEDTDLASSLRNHVPATTFITGTVIPIYLADILSYFEAVSPQEDMESVRTLTLVIVACN